MQEKAQVYAKLNRATVSPKKLAIVMDMIRGKSLHEAKLILAFDSSKPAKALLKTVKSAEANASNNHNLKPEGLYISELYVNTAQTRKWGYAGSKGRFDPIIRRRSHITVGLSERKTAKKGSK